MNELIEYQCVDFKKLLILKAKSLKLTDQECYVLLILLTMNEISMRPINPQNISQLCSLSIKNIDKTLISLLDKNMIARRYGKLDLTPLFQTLLNQEIRKDKQVDLISIFEDSFARTLNQMELDIIQSFKTNGYEDQMIIDALNEAVKSGAINFRYIEKILDNWSKYGVKRRYAPTVNKKEDSFSNEIKEYKWWENNE